MSTPTIPKEDARLVKEFIEEDFDGWYRGDRCSRGSSEELSRWQQAVEMMIHELRESWDTYSNNATVTDGHADGCKNVALECSCGLSRVERAIRALVRTGDSE